MPAERARATGPTPRVVLTEDGPVLVPGPVEVVLPDGRRVRSERPVTALCTCRRSRRYPICDTSHRTRTRAPDPAPDSGPAPDQGREPC